jgi:hypothetical protein
MISRALVAILLMMNLGVAAWWLLRGPTEASDSDGDAAALAGVPRLVLLSERAASPSVPDDVVATAAPEPAIAAPSEAVAATAEPAALPPPAPESVPQAAVPAVTDAAAAPTADAAEIVCFSIGPFQSLADLRRVSAALEPALQRQQVREAKGIEARGYRVYLPAFASRQEALLTARVLEGRGLRDYYVVTAGSGENTVSLGLFRELANAEARRDEVRGYGYEARLEPRNEEVTRWWLDIATRADSGWRERAGNFPGTHVETMVCQ